MEKQALYPSLEGRGFTAYSIKYEKKSYEKDCHKKVSIIARCLVNTKIFTDMSEAESSIEKIFNDSYSEHSFDEWNTEVSELSPNRVIARVAIASKVRVRSLIQELWNH